jgi:hypothetical protein
MHSQTPRTVRALRCSTRTFPKRTYSCARSSALSSAHTHKPCASYTRLTTPRKAGQARLATSVASLSRRMFRQPSSARRSRCSFVVRLSYSAFFFRLVFCVLTNDCLCARSSGAGLGRRREKGRHEARRDWRDPQGTGIQRGTGVQVLDIDIDPGLGSTPVYPQNTAIRWRTMLMHVYIVILVRFPSGAFACSARQEGSRILICPKPSWFPNRRSTRQPRAAVFIQRPTYPLTGFMGALTTPPTIALGPKDSTQKGIASIADVQIAVYE